VNEPASTVIVESADLKQESSKDGNTAENSVQPKAQLLIFGENDEQCLVPAQGKKEKDVLGSFSNKEFALIVRKLFANDKPAFLGAITEICLLRTWEEVAQYLDKLFLMNQADPFSKVAVKFTDKLYAHFHSAGVKT
jgi:hypothetical protein